MSPATASSPQPRSIVIVGGGIVGSSIAYYLSRATSAVKPRITLLETSSGPAPAASGKAGGFLALDWHGAATASLAALSFKLHRELADQDGGHEKWGYREVETWQVNVDTSLRERGKKAKGSAIQWLDQDIVKSTSSMGGSGSTAQVTPGKLTQHLVDRAQEQGIEAHFGTRATGLEFDDSGAVTGVKVASTNGGDERTLPATDLVVAAGPWTGSLLTHLFPRKLMPSFLKAATSIEGSRAHSIILESPPAHPLSADCLFTDMAYGPGGRQAGAPELYCRPDGTAYVCGGSDDVPLPDTADEVGYDAKKTKALIEQSRVLSPSSLDVDKGAKVVAEQACYLPVSSRTGNPIVGGKDGVYVAAGHSCWGITNSLGTGKVMAELILDGKVTSADIRGLMPQ